MDNNIMHLLINAMNSSEIKQGNEEIIASYILKNLNNFNDITIDDLANNCYTSTPTVSRFIKNVGYPNFSEFRNAVTSFNTYNKKINMDITYKQYLDNIKLNVEYMKNALPKEQLEKVVDMIYESKNASIVAFDYSHIAAQNLQLKLLNANKLLKLYTNEQNHLKTINNDKTDLVIIFSISGNTTMIMNIMDSMRNDIEVVVITSKEDSPVTKVASEIILIPGEFVDDIYVSTTGFIYQNILVDLLYFHFNNKYM